MIVPPEIDTTRLEDDATDQYGVDELAGVIVDLDDWYNERGNLADAEGWARILLGLDEPAEQLD